MVKLRSAVVTAAMLFAASAGAYAATVPSFEPDSGQPVVGAAGYPDFWSLDYSASLTKTNSSTYTLSIIGNDPNPLQKNGVASVFNFPNADYYVSNETLNITANFSTTGVFNSGTFEIDGSLNSWSNPIVGSPPAGYQNAKVDASCTSNCATWQNNSIPTQKLFSATLTNVGVDTHDEALGFSINNFGGWADQKAFTNNGVESLWLYALCSNQPNCGYQAGSMTGFSDNDSNSAWNTFLAEIKGHSALVANQFYDIASIATVPLPAAGLLLFSGLGFGGMVALRGRRAEPAAA
jgi:hypothetical protein